MASSQFRMLQAKVAALAGMSRSLGNNVFAHLDYLADECRSF